MSLFDDIKEAQEAFASFFTAETLPAPAPEQAPDSAPPTVIDTPGETVDP